MAVFRLLRDAGRPILGLQTFEICGIGSDVYSQRVVKEFAVASTTVSQVLARANVFTADSLYASK